MYKKVFKQIKKYENIVIARHISIDPDAMASQIALKETIKLTFPNKKVYAVGNGTVKFNYIGKLDKNITIEDYNNTLLIILDTPDKKRVDITNFDNYQHKIKIDHHMFMETFCDLEIIDEDKSSASEMIYDLINSTKLKINKNIAEILFYGIIADTNRFLFTKNSETFDAVESLIKRFDLDITALYSNLYKRPFNELQVQGYMAMNMKITNNGVGYIKMTEDVINKFHFDSPSLGDAINDFNYVNELLVWMSAIEDSKNNCIRVSIRSRGPIINKIAEKYNGGGHKLACGARVPSYDEVDFLIKELDQLCESYIESSEDINEN